MEALKAFTLMIFLLAIAFFLALDLLYEEPVLNQHSLEYKSFNATPEKDLNPITSTDRRSRLFWARYNESEQEEQLLHAEKQKKKRLFREFDGITYWGYDEELDKKIIQNGKEVLVN